MTVPVHIAAARALVGKPFEHRGRGPDRWDCLGIIIAGAAARGVALKDRRAYGRHPISDGLYAELVAQFGPPVPGLPRIGQLGCFRFDGEPHHVGWFGNYFLGGLSLIHAYADVQKVAEHRFAGSGWDRRLCAVFQHPELEVV
jgi:hypothetical protein